MTSTPVASSARSRLVGLVAAVALVLTGCAATPVASTSAPSPSVTATSAAASPSPASPSPQATTATPTPEPTPSATTATPTPSAAVVLLKTGSTGDDVKKLQARLIQLEWLDEATVSGTYDQRTADAVQGFQDKRDLPTTGEVDQVTWDRLVSMTKEPTADQLNNVLVPGPALYKKGSTGDKVRDLQARLAQLDWYSAAVDGTYGDATVTGVKGFQGKRAIPVTGEVDQRTLDRLRAMTRTPTRTELGLPPATNAGATLDDRCTTGRVLCIDKTTRTLRWVIDGQVRMTLDVRFGSEYTPTREGTFKVDSKSRDHVSTIYHTAMPFAMFFSGGQAVHYSSDFAARGYNGASHGCVNVRDKAAITSLFDQVNVGDKVIVYRS